MIRSRLRFMAIIALMMILVLFAIGRVNTVAYIKGPLGISPNPSAFTIPIELYYVNNDYLLESEKRPLVIKDNDVVAAVVDALKEKPQVEYLRSVINPSVRILSAEITNKKLYLDLSNEILNNGIWQRGYYDLIVYSLVNSLTQFESIERVQLKINGQDIYTFIESDNVVSEFAYNEQLVYNPPLSPREVINTFLKYAMIERYDLAYRMTTAFSTLEMNDSGFTQYMRSYRASKLSYSIIADQHSVRRCGRCTDCG